MLKPLDLSTKRDFVKLIRMGRPSWRRKRRPVLLCLVICEFFFFNRICQFKSFLGGGTADLSLWHIFFLAGWIRCILCLRSMSELAWTNCWIVMPYSPVFFFLPFLLWFCAAHSRARFQLHLAPKSDVAPAVYDLQRLRDWARSHYDCTYHLVCYSS